MVLFRFIFFFDERLMWEVCSGAMTRIIIQTRLSLFGNGTADDADSFDPPEDSLSVQHVYITVPLILLLSGPEKDPGGSCTVD
jgi:hypothetical protein